MGVGGWQGQDPAYARPGSLAVAAVVLPVGSYYSGSCRPCLCYSVNASHLFKVYFLITQTIHEHLRRVHK